jgi:hypothetical protein
MGGGPCIMHGGKARQVKAPVGIGCGDNSAPDALNAVLATAAVERLDGDPLWLPVISGSGNAKTETVQTLTGQSHPREHYVVRRCTPVRHVYERGG